MMRFILSAVFISIFAINANAASLFCTGKVKDMFIDSKGDVNIRPDWAPKWTKICSTKDSDVVRCSLWTSMAMTAIKDNLTFRVSYLGSPYECGTLPAYDNAPTPHYVMLYNDH